MNKLRSILKKRRAKEDPRVRRRLFSWRMFAMTLLVVSVLSADTRDLSGQCYGSMLLKLPADVEQAKQAAAYMRSQPGVTVEEVTGE